MLKVNKAPQKFLCWVDTNKVIYYELCMWDLCSANNIHNTGHLRSYNDDDNNNDDVHNDDDDDDCDDEDESDFEHDNDDDSVCGDMHAVFRINTVEILVWPLWIVLLQVNCKAWNTTNGYETFTKFPTLNHLPQIFQIHKRCIFMGLLPDY